MENKQPENQSATANPKRLNGIFIIALFVFTIIVFNYRPPLEHIYCEDTSSPVSPEVILLGTWWCPYCYDARRYMTSNNISYCEYDIERSDKGRRMFDDVNGRAIPVLITGDFMMNGFDASRLESMLAQAREKQ